MLCLAMSLLPIGMFANVDDVNQMVNQNVWKISRLAVNCMWWYVYICMPLQCINIHCRHVIVQCWMLILVMHVYWIKLACVLVQMPHIISCGMRKHNTKFELIYLFVSADICTLILELLSVLAKLAYTQYEMFERWSGLTNVSRTFPRFTKKCVPPWWKIRLLCSVFPDPQLCCRPQG